MQDVITEAVDATRQCLDDIMKDPSKVIKQASAGDITSCTLVQAAVRSECLPQSLVPAAAEMFAAQIQSSGPPDKATFRSMRLAETSFYGLSSILCMPLQEEEAPLQSILQAWSSILDWAEALFLPNSHKQESLRRDSPEMLAQLALFVDGVNNRCSRDSIHDKRLLELVMHLFLSSGAPLDFKYICMVYFDHYVEVGLFKSDSKHITYEKALDDLQSAVQGNPERLIDPVLALLNASDPRGTPEINVKLMCLEFLRRIASVPNHPFALTFREKGLTSFTKALTRLTEQLHIQSDPFFVHAFRLCLCLVTVSSSPRSGSSWLLNALQCRLFYLLAANSSELGKGSGNLPFVLKQLISRIVPCHLVNPSVIFATEMALSEVSAEHHKQIMNSALAPAWRTFIQRFFEQYIFYCYFEVAVTHRGCYKCSNAVGEDGVSGLKRCSGCKNVEYCSSVCQSTDWKDHKKECKFLRDKKRSPLPRWAHTVFRRRLAAHDARRHLPGIRAMAQQMHPGFPLQCVCVMFDYTNFPPRLAVPLAKSVPKMPKWLLQQSLNPKFREPCFDDVRLHDGSTSVLGVLEYESGELAREQTFQMFHWSMPYFCSNFGTQCRDVSMRATSLMTKYADVNGKDVETVWSVLDEIAFRANLTPQTILEGKMGEIRRKVIEVVTREKARMKLADK